MGLSVTLEVSLFGLIKVTRQPKSAWIMRYLHWGRENRCGFLSVFLLLRLSSLYILHFIGTIPEGWGSFIGKLLFASEGYWIPMCKVFIGFWTWIFINNLRNFRRTSYLTCVFKMFLWLPCEKWTIGQQKWKPQS